ncbi:MAG: G1 family glutamic endopeptidase [Acidimicrobiales bacterium]
MAAATICGSALAFAGGAAAVSGAATTVAQAGSGGRMIHVPGGFDRKVNGATQVESTNWSGYAQSTSTKGTFSAVVDTWTVPTVTTMSGDQYASDWVGIGGFSEGTLVQAGTSEWNAGGTAKYNAWTEILPASEVVISGLAISPGNKIKTVVKETSANTWLMEVYNLTTGKSGGKTVSYDSSGESVESIHERPEINGELATLAKTTNVTFNPGKYSTSGAGKPTWEPLLGTAPHSSTLYQIFMVNNGGTAKIASPSLPSSNLKGFTVAYGATSPPPPA